MFVVLIVCIQSNVLNILIFVRLLANDLALFAKREV